MLLTLLTFAVAPTWARAEGSSIRCLRGELTSEVAVQAAGEEPAQADLALQTGKVLDFLFPSRARKRLAGQLKAYRNTEIELERAFKEKGSSKERQMAANHKVLEAAKVLFENAGLDAEIIIGDWLTEKPEVLRLKTRNGSSDNVASAPWRMIAVAHRRGDTVNFAPGYCLERNVLGSQLQGHVVLGLETFPANDLYKDSGTVQHETAVHANNSYRARLAKPLTSAVQQRLTSLTGDGLTVPNAKWVNWYDKYRRHDEIQARTNGDLPALFRQLDRLGNRLDAATLAKLAHQGVASYNQVVYLINADLTDYKTARDALSGVGHARTGRVVIQGSSLSHFELEGSPTARMEFGIEVVEPRPDGSERKFTVSAPFDLAPVANETPANFIARINRIAADPSSSSSADVRRFERQILEHLERLTSDLEALQARTGALTRELNATYGKNDYVAAMKSLRKALGLLSARDE